MAKSFLCSSKNGVYDIKFMNNSVLKTLNNNVVELASARLDKHPFIVTEWNIPYPNEFRFVGPVMMASYGSLQGWNGILQFCFNTPHFKEQIDEIFDISLSPAVMAQWIAASMIFHNSYIKESSHYVVDKVGKFDIFYNENSSFRYVGNKLYTPLICKVGKDYTDSFDSDFSDISGLINHYYDETNKIVSSDTGEIKWNYDKGYIILNSDYVQGILGNTEMIEYKFQNITIKPYTKLCSIILISMDREPIKTSKEMLLITTGEELNDKTEFNSSRTKIVDNGDGFIKIEPVAGEIKFKSMKNLEIHPYDISGSRTDKKIKIDDKFSFGDKYKTMFYEISSE